MELELQHLIGYARRWWWLLIALPLIAGGIAYAASSRQADLYSARATLLIKPAQTGSSGGLEAAIRSGQSLATTYQQLATIRPVLDPIPAQLGLPYGVEVLEDQVSASTVRDTQLLRISASDTDPERAAAIANAVAQRFADFITERELATASEAGTALQGLIDSTQTEVNTVRGQIAALEGSSNAADQDRAANLRSRLDQLETSLGNYLAQAQELDLQEAAFQNQVQLYDPATMPTAPYAPRVLFYSLLAAFLGLIGAVGVVALLEYLDNTVKAGLDFPGLLGAPLLSVIAAIPRLRAGKEQLFVVDATRSTAAEAVRLLRANLEFAAAAAEIRCLAVTSPSPGDGKSTVTANLAVAMAQAGFSVVVVDADLRRPTQHRIFARPNERGLTTLLTHPDLPWRGAATQVVTPNLSLISSGPLPPNPADLLTLTRFRDLLAELAQEVDVVLVDTPPVLAVSDPLAVAPHVDGMVVVCTAGKTRIEAVKRSMALLQQGSVRVVGVVLNQQRGRSSDAYYGYYEGYYGPKDPQASDGTPRPAKSGPFARGREREHPAATAR